MEPSRVLEGRDSMRKYQLESSMFHALAHPVRLQILGILHQRPACVCDLVLLTGQRQPYISQQLMILKAAGLVDFRSDGSKNYY